jgi:hypothetical protein
MFLSNYYLTVSYLDKNYQNNIANLFENMLYEDNEYNEKEVRI